MSVDESTVIFGPIDQVGWASASSIGDVGQLGLRPPAERPAARGEHDAAHPVARLAVGVLGAQALVDGAVLAVDRHQLAAPGCARTRRTTGPAAISDSLLASARRVPGREGREGDARARRSRRRR